MSLLCFTQKQTTSPFTCQEVNYCTFGIFTSRVPTTRITWRFFHIGLKCAYKTLTTSYATNSMCYQLYYRLRSYQFTQTQPKCMQHFPLNVYTPKQATPNWGKSMSLLFLVIETRRPTPNRCHRRICIPCYRLHVTCLFIKDIAYKQKSVEPVLLPVPRSEGSRISQSVWNEQRWKPHTDACINIRPAGHSPQSKLMYTNITWSVSRCFVFDGF